MSPPPGSADGASSRSVVVGAAATGRHLIDIEGYSHTKPQLPTGRGVVLCPFSVGEHSWRLRFYPNSDTADFADFISVSVEYLPCQGPHYLRASAEEVDVRVTLSLLDHAGEPVLSQAKTTAMHQFSQSAGGISFHDFINRAWLEASEYLRDDRFTISCDVVIPLEVRTQEKAAAKPPPPPKQAAAPLVVVPPSDLHRHLGSLRVAEEGADVAFQVAGETFRAHRCVLAARSTVFRAELFGAMKESADDDTAGVVIRVDDMEAEVFRALLAFLYTDALPDAPDTKQQEEAAMLQHLLVAADRYNLERLKLICEDKLCKHIHTGSAATILALAEQHNCGGLKKGCLQFLSSTSSLIDVLATDADGFEHLARSCPSVMKELIHNISTGAPAVELRQEIRQEGRRNGKEEDMVAAPTLLPADFLTMDDQRRGMILSGRRTNYWYQVLVLVILCVALSLNGGSKLISCICLLVASFIGTTIN